jgi:hypothetical protein
VGITHLGTTYVIPPSYNRYITLQSGALSWVVPRWWQRSGSCRDSESDGCGRGFVLSRASCPRSCRPVIAVATDRICSVDSGVLVLKVCVKRKEWGTDRLLALGRLSSPIIYPVHLISCNSLSRRSRARGVGGHLKCFSICAKCEEASQKGRKK